jgi:hypothetical protein
MPYPQYQFGDPATTGYQQAAKAQMQKEQATPVNFDPNQLAQQAFGPAPDAPFVPAQAQPVSTLDTSALTPNAPKGPQMVEVPEQTVQMRVQTPEQKKLEARAAATADLARLDEMRAQASESTLRESAYSKASEYFEQAKQEHEQAQKELANQKLIDPMDKWGTAGKIGAAIAMGMGAYAAAFTGGRNYAIEIIDSSIKRDLQLQESEINRLGKNVDEKKNALAFAYKRFGDIEQAKDAVYAASLAGITNQVKDQIAAAKSDKAKANGSAMMSALATKQAAAAERTNEMLVTKSVRGQMMQPKETAAKAMTEAQGKAYAYVESMKQAEPIIASHENYGATISGSAAQKLPQFAMPEKAKQLAQAQEAFAEGYIRFASGANVPKAEIESTLRRAMPQPNDKAKDLEQKRAYRAQLIRSMEVVARGEQPDRGTDSNKRNQQLGFKQ